MSKDSRESSRQKWNVPDTIEGINCGSLQRIADATETMARNYQQLIEERNTYENWYKAERERARGLRRSVISLRGAITRLKNQLSQAKAQSGGAQ